MTRICKAKDCNNEIPEGRKVPYCDACRYRMAKRVKDGLSVAGAAVGVVLSAGAAVIFARKDK